MSRRALATCAILGAVLLACSGRTALDATPAQGRPLFVQDVLFPTPVASGQTCEYTADPNQTALSAGVLDLAFRNEYRPTVLVGNQPQPTTAASDSSSAGVELQGANVRVEDDAGTAVDSFSTVASGFVYPATGDIPGYSVLTLTFLDATATASVSPLSSGQVKRLVAYVTVLGRTRGGLQVQSDEFVFPIDICNGCLVTFTAADIDPTLTTPNCAGNQALGGANTSLPVPCVPGQDTPVDCIDCQTFPICRGAAGGSDGG